MAQECMSLFETKKLPQVADIEQVSALVVSWRQPINLTNGTLPVLRYWSHS